MSITKSIILTALLYLITAALDLVILLFNWNVPAYQHIVGLLEIFSYLIAFSLFIIYFRVTNLNTSVAEGSTIKAVQILVPALVILAVGDHLVDLPFFHWKNLSNTYFGTNWQIPNYSNYNNSTLQLYRVFSVLVLAPILEEIFFRYYLFGGLLKRYKISTALITSSILFALVHVDSLKSIRNIVPAFIFGVITCLVYFRTKNILNSIILHVFANTIWFMTVLFAKQYSNLIKLTGYGVMFWTAFLTGIMLLWIGLRKITTANNRFAASMQRVGFADK